MVEWDFRSGGDVRVGSQCRGSADLHEQLAGIDKVLADAVSTSPVAALLADDTQTLTERWAAASLDILGKVVNELMIRPRSKSIGAE